MRKENVSKRVEVNKPLCEMVVLKVLFWKEQPQENWELVEMQINQTLMKHTKSKILGREPSVLKFLQVILVLILRNISVRSLHLFVFKLASESCLLESLHLMMF